MPRKLPDKYKRYNDYKLLITILVLCCFGLVMVYSSSAYVAQTRWKDDFYFLKRQFAFIVAGIIAMLIVSRIDYHRFIKPWTLLLYFGSLGLMILVDFTPFGVELNGQKRWLNIVPGVSKLPTYQPTELVKIAVILVFAYMINRCMRNLDKWTVMIFMILILALPAGLVLINNLSSGIIILGIGALMYFSASRRKILYLVITAAAVAAVIVIYNNPEILLRLPFIEKYQLSRINIWKDPASDPLNGGYQVLQGLYAVGSGGLFGKGLGSSVQKQGFIPEAYNDMIFSIICEELGIFGAVCVLGLFAYLIYRCIYIISRSQDLYGAMIVTGVMIQIALQTVLNVAVVINAIPNTGVSLPFISYGGTSVAILLAEMGMVLSVARQIIYEKD
ncbi:MAG: cell division protein FtsW [Lachnospiraceae bacterium]|nr:cell division protein FtsW [Lachnospiraceae bacterium]